MRGRVSFWHGLVSLRPEGLGPHRQRGDDVDVVIPVEDGYGASDMRMIKTSERRLTDSRWVSEWVSEGFCGS